MHKLRGGGGTVLRGAAGITFALLLFGAASTQVVAASETASAMTALPGCRAHTLPANDDESSDAVPMGFTVNFFGRLYHELFVNNDGNISFGEPVSAYTPDGLSAPGHFPTLAPFWADVDTSGPGSGLVTYGTTRYNGEAAFCVVWPMVGYYASRTDKRNDFQLLIVDRQDTGTDNFDFIFNYNQVRWETGDDSGGSDGLGGDCARAGYTNGSGRAGEHYEVPGSGKCGALLDSNSSTGLTQTALNSGTKGQFVFSVRNGLVSAAGGCLNLASCFNGAGAAGLAVGGAALVTFVGIGGVGVIRPHAPLSLQALHGSAAAAATTAGGHSAMAAAPPPPPTHFQEEAGSKLFETGGAGLEVGLQGVEERAARDAMADSSVADASFPGAARMARDRAGAPPDGAPPPPPPPPP